MTHSCSGDEAQDPLDHAETCAQDGHDHQPVFPDATVAHGFQRGLERHNLARQVARDFDGHEHGDLCHQPAKLVVSGAPVPQEGEFVPEQRVVDHGERFRHASLVGYVSDERAPGLSAAARHGR